MNPKLIPYFVITYEKVNPVSGANCSEYTKHYDLYDVECGKIISCKFQGVKYIDFSMKKSISMIIEHKIHDRWKYAIISSVDDLSDMHWYDNLTAITSNMLVAEQNKSFGIIDEHSNIIVPFIYTKVNAYQCEGSIYLIVCKDNKYGMVNACGECIFPCLYECITCNSTLGVFTLLLDNITKIWNPQTNEEMIFNVCATETIFISEGVALLKNKEFRYLLYNIEQKKLVANYSYSSATPMINGFSLCCGYILVYKDGRQFEFDKDSNLCRSKSILYKTNHIVNDDWQITIFKENKFVSSFKFTKRGRGFFTAKIYDDKYVKLGTYNDKFDIESVEYYDIYGNKFTDKGILTTIKIIRESEYKKNIINNITSRSSNLREQEEHQREHLLI